MKNKMLKFVDLKQETPLKEKLMTDVKILMRSITNILMLKQKSNQVDALNAEFHFVKFTAL